MRDLRERRLTELYAQHAARMYLYARRHGHPSAAEDLVADAFVIALRRIDDVPTDPDEARAWLIGTVRKLAANRRRREASHADWWESAVREGWRARADASAEEVAAERDACLRSLASLCESDREAILLVGWEGLSHDQAAEVVGVTRNAFYVRLHRARRRLDRSLGTDPVLRAMTTEGTR